MSRFKIQILLFSHSSFIPPFFFLSFITLIFPFSFFSIFCLQPVYYILKQKTKKTVLRYMSFICSIVTNHQNLMAERSTTYVPPNSAGWHLSGLSWVVLLIWVRVNWVYSCFCSQLTDWQEAVWSQVTLHTSLAAVWLSDWKMEISVWLLSHHSTCESRLVHMEVSGFTEQ